MGKDTFTLAGQEWPKVTWWRTKYMRSLYLYLWAAMLTSATNGMRFRCKNLTRPRNNSLIAMEQATTAP